MKLTYQLTTDKCNPTSYIKNLITIFPPKNNFINILPKYLIIMGTFPFLFFHKIFITFEYFFPIHS